MVRTDELQGRFIFFDSFTDHNRYYVGGCVVLDVFPKQDAGVVGFFGPGNKFMHVRIGLYSLQRRAEIPYDYDEVVAHTAIKYIFENQFI